LSNESFSLRQNATNQRHIATFVTYSGFGKIGNDLVTELCRTLSWECRNLSPDKY